MLVCKAAQITTERTVWSYRMVCFMRRDIEISFFRTRAHRVNSRGAEVYPVGKTESNVHSRNIKHRGRRQSSRSPATRRFTPAWFPSPNSTDSNCRFWQPLFWATVLLFSNLHPRLRRQLHTLATSASGAICDNSFILWQLPPSISATVTHFRNKICISPHV